MSFDGHTKTWEFLSEVAAFDGSAEQVEQWAKEYRELNEQKPEVKS